MASMWKNAAAVLAALGLAALVAAQDRAAAPSPDDPAWAPHRALRILYAGSPGGHREKVFAEFLGRWFDGSGTIPLEELSMATAADYDVVIVDWVSQYGNDGYPARDNSLFSAPIRLAPDFTRPIVAMTYVGTQVRPGQKLDWL
jgi:hypothetical protein